MIATTIRSFEQSDAAAVRALFIEVNRFLAPAGMEAAFQAYVERCLAEEIDRVAAYYDEHGGGFWVATGLDPRSIIGMFGLEAAPSSGMELRRMYVDPSERRAGIGTAMLTRAEDECRRRGMKRLVLSTSELQGAAIALYRAAGYREQGATTAVESANRTVGGGLRRIRFEKVFIWSPSRRYLSL